jgi:hypothetical protein
MAFINDVLRAVQVQVQAVCNAVPGITVYSGIDFPPIKTLMDNVRGGTAVVAVVDRKATRNTTRWMPAVVSQSITAPGIGAAVSLTSLSPGHPSTITLSGSVITGDAVSCVLTGPTQTIANTATSSWATVALATPGMTLAQLATRLASQINADPILSVWVSAAAVGAAVTLTAKLSSGTIRVQSYTGNNGTQITEIGRRNSALQIITWARTVENRQAVGDAIAVMVAQMEVFTGLYTNGLALPDGTSARVAAMNDYHLDDASPSDTYRRDILLTVDYAITTTDHLYSILAPIQQYQIAH